MNGVMVPWKFVGPTRFPCAFCRRGQRSQTLNDGRNRTTDSAHFFGYFRDILGGDSCVLRGEFFQERCLEFYGRQRIVDFVGDSSRKLREKVHRALAGASKFALIRELLEFLKSPRCNERERRNEYVELKGGDSIRKRDLVSHHHDRRPKQEMGEAEIKCRTKTQSKSRSHCRDHGKKCGHERRARFQQGNGSRGACRAANQKQPNCGVQLASQKEPSQQGQGG